MPYFINIFVFLTFLLGFEGNQINQSNATIEINPIYADYVSRGLSGRLHQENLKESKFKIIAPNLYQFKDISNVYLLKSGTSAILIDSGAGKVLEHLDEIGVDYIDWVLHTHYHRDQCLGDLKLKEKGSKVAIGALEANFLQPYESTAPFKMPKKYLLNGELPGWGRRMAPFEPPGVDHQFTDGEEFRWKEYVIKVIYTPGHTRGSVSYLLDIDGKQILLSGDLIMSGGHIRDLYSMQWTYLENPGIDSTINSLQKIKSLDIGTLLPSHGEIIDNPAVEIKKLHIRLQKAQKYLKVKRAGRWNWSEFVQVSKHVIQDSGSTSQIIISDSGEALLFDCGMGLTKERLEEAKNKFGFKKISVIIPSHWHYDHVDGIRSMEESEDAQVWVWEGLAEHLEYPNHFITTCWTGKSIQPDRVLLEGESFRWKEYSFKVYHHPVHMEEQMALKANVDGMTFLLTADGTRLSKEGNIRSAIHCYNGITLSTGLLKTAASFYDADPYICLPAHSNVFALHNNDKEEFIQWATETTAAITDLLSPPYPEFGYEPYWTTIYPARVETKKGAKIQVMIRVKNPAKATISGRIWPKYYGELKIKKESIEFKLQPGETKDFPIEVTVDKEAKIGIHIITADIEYNGEIMSELCQGYIQIE